MRLIDTHFHLDYYKDHEYWFGQINRLEQYTLCVTNSPEVYHSCKKLYGETKYVKFALGYNPQLAGEVEFNKRIFSSQLPTTRYIGEIGLDFSKYHISTKKQQIDAFSFICKSVAQQNKIMSVHTRNAEDMALQIMSDFGIENAIIHWYTGDLPTMNALIDRGCYFSVNANMCSTIKGREIVANIPSDRLLIESDGPFTKVGRSKFTPLKLKEVYKLVEDTVGFAELEKRLWDNFAKLLET